MTRVSQLRGWAKTVQAMRANLLASAVAIRTRVREAEAALGVSAPDLDSLHVLEQTMVHFYMRAMVLKNKGGKSELIDANLRDAAAIAEKVAPYRHPRLSAMKLAGDPNDPMRIRDDASTEELRAELMKRLAELADRGPERPTSRYPDRLSWPFASVAPPNRGSLNSAHIHGTHAPGGGAVHSIKSGSPGLSRRGLLYPETGHRLKISVGHAAMDAAIANNPDQRITLLNGIHTLCGGIRELNRDA
jgi:hypothetical protein